MYYIVANVLDSNGNQIGYRLKKDNTCEFFKYSIKDTKTLTLRGEVANARVVNNELILNNITKMALFNEVHNTSKFVARVEYIVYTKDAKIVDNERLQCLAGSISEAIDSVEEHLKTGGEVGNTIVKQLVAELKERSKSRIDQDMGIMAYKIYEKGKYNRMVLVTIQGYSDDLRNLSLARLNEYIAQSNMEVTQVDLQSLYYYLNNMCFGNSIVLDYIVWSGRLISSAGNSCVRNKDGYRYAEINMSPHYHKKYMDEIVSTLLHEMVHQLPECMNHGVLFNVMINRLGCYGVEVTLKSKETALIRYIYTCRECGYKYRRAKKLQYEEHRRCKCGGKLTRSEV